MDASENKFDVPQPREVMADSRMQQCLGIPDGYEGECFSILFGGLGIKKPLKVARRGLGHFLILLESAGVLFRFPNPEGVS